MGAGRTFTAAQLNAFRRAQRAMSKTLGVPVRMGKGRTELGEAWVAFSRDAIDGWGGPISLATVTCERTDRGHDLTLLSGTFEYVNGSIGSGCLSGLVVEATRGAAQSSAAFHRAR